MDTKEMNFDVLKCAIMKDFQDFFSQNIFDMVTENFEWTFEILFDHAGEHIMGNKS